MIQSRQQESFPCSLRLRQLTSELDQGTYLEPTKLTVKSWLETWQEEYLQDVKPSTAYKYKVDINNYKIRFIAERNNTDGKGLFC